MGTQSQAYTLELEAQEACLYGVIPSTAEDEALPTHGGMAELRQRLDEGGYNELFFPPDALSLFLKKLDEGAAGRHLLAERRDASVIVDIARDKKTVTLKYTPQMGGLALSLDSIEKQLIDHGVAKETLLRDRIEKLLLENKARSVVVAQAIKPEKGEDAKFKSLVQSQTLKDHDLDSLQAIDMRDLFEYTTVAVGQPLMEKIPPTPGKDGMDVMGKIISAKAGKDAKFDNKRDGATLSEDGLTLLAEIEGYPIIGGRSVKVDPVLNVKAVDLSTGHIDFKGTLIVQKEIESQYDVKATGDILVGGSIIRTNIHAGGNLQVKGGIHAEATEKDSECEIKVGANLQAKFLNQVNIQCGGSVEVEEYILQSRVRSVGTVSAGMSRGKGAIIGGQIESRSAIMAKTLGSDAYLKTQLKIQVDEAGRQASQKISTLLDKRRKEQIQLESILAKIHASNEQSKIGGLAFDKTKKIQETLAVLAEKIEQLENAQNELAQESIELDDVHVSAQKEIFPNVQVLIKDYPWHCQHKLGASTLHYSNEAVVAGPYVEPTKKSKREAK